MNEAIKELKPKRKKRFIQAKKHSEQRPNKKSKDKDHKKFSREKEYNKDKDTQKKGEKVMYEFELEN